MHTEAESHMHAAASHSHSSAQVPGVTVQEPDEHDADEGVPCQPAAAAQVVVQGAGSPLCTGSVQLHGMMPGGLTDGWEVQSASQTPGATVQLPC